MRTRGGGALGDRRGAGVREQGLAVRSGGEVGEGGLLLVQVGLWPPAPRGLYSASSLSCEKCIWGLGFYTGAFSLHTGSFGVEHAHRGDGDAAGSAYRNLVAAQPAARTARLAALGPLAGAPRAAPRGRCRGVVPSGGDPAGRRSGLGHRRATRGQGRRGTHTGLRLDGFLYSIRIPDVRSMSRPKYDRCQGTGTGQGYLRTIRLDAAPRTRGGRARRGSPSSRLLRRRGAARSRGRFRVDGNPAATQPAATPRRRAGGTARRGVRGGLRPRQRAPHTLGHRVRGAHAAAPAAHNAGG